MKIISISRVAITIFSSLFWLNSFGQLEPVLYGGADYYRNTGFVSNAYANIHVGAQIFQWEFLAPEVGFEYHFGVPNDQELLNSRDPNGRPPSILETKFSSGTFSVAPKIKIGNKEAAAVIIPQYNFGKYSSRGDLLKDSGKQYILEERQRISGSTDFWSFAAGVEGQFWESDILHFSLLLKYSLLNSKEMLSQIDVGEPTLNSAAGSGDGIGLEIRVYFDLLQLFQQ